MDILGVLGWVIGLATVYLVMALSVTAANEGIAAMLSSRGIWLKRGVLALLAPAGAPLGRLSGVRNRLAATFATLPSGLADDKTKKIVEAKGLRDGAYQSPFIAHLASGPLGKGFVPSYVPAWTMLQGILHAASKGATTVFNTIDAVKAAADQLPEGSPIRIAILGQIEACNGSIDEFRRKFEAWFSEFENQITAWYRQKTHGVVVVLSALMVIAANVDTFAIVRQLSVDPKLREAVAQVGLSTVEKGDIESLLNTKDRDQARKALDQAREAARLAGERNDPPTAPEKLVELRKSTEVALQTYLVRQNELDKRVDAKRVALEGTGLKMGWEPDEWRGLWDAGGAPLLLKMLGLLMSILAVSLGAPFWFNVLKDLASARSVGLNLNEQAKREN